MEFRDYIWLAMRTLPEGREDKDNLLNGCLGLAGEFAEYDELRDVGTKEDKVDELGDIHWYTALMSYALGFRGTPKKTDKSTLSVIGGICDYVKKAVYQGHELVPKEIDIRLGNLLFRLEEEAKIVGATSIEVMEHNVNKLKARYPQGFSVEESVNRKGEV